MCSKAPSKAAIFWMSGEDLIRDVSSRTASFRITSRESPSKSISCTTPIGAARMACSNRNPVRLLPQSGAVHCP